MPLHGDRSPFHASDKSITCSQGLGHSHMGIAEHSKKRKNKFSFLSHGTNGGFGKNLCMAQDTMLFD